MNGLFRFDFYPKDWLTGTRDLFAGEKGTYIDLLAAMYARGGPLPNDERELCRVTGCATVRSLRPLLAGLIAKGKLKVVDGYLINDRVQEELAQYETRRASSAGGGRARWNRAEEARSGGTRAETPIDIVENQEDDRSRPPAPPDDRNGGHDDPGKARSARVQPQYHGNSSGTRAETRAENVGNQQHDLCLVPSPSPSPLPKEEKEDYSPSLIHQETARAREIDVPPELFGRFWEAFPRRYQHGEKKFLSQQVFEATVADGIDPELLIAGAERYARERQDQDPKYTAVAANWLSQRRWEDNPDEAHVNFIAPGRGADMTRAVAAAQARIDAEIAAEEGEAHDEG